MNLPTVIELAPTRALSLADAGALTGTPIAAGIEAGELELTVRDAEHGERERAFRKERDEALKTLGDAANAERVKAESGAEAA